jgi:hypothetical protein
MYVCVLELNKGTSSAPSLRNTHFFLKGRTHTHFVVISVIVIYDSMAQQGCKKSWSLGLTPVRSPPRTKLENAQLDARRTPPVLQTPAGPGNSMKRKRKSNLRGLSRSAPRPCIHVVAVEKAREILPRPGGGRRL